MRSASPERLSLLPGCLASQIPYSPEPFVFSLSKAPLFFSSCLIQASSSVCFSSRPRTALSRALSALDLLTSCARLARPPSCGRFSAPDGRGRHGVVSDGLHFLRGRWPQNASHAGPEHGNERKGGGFPVGSPSFLQGFFWFLWISLVFSRKKHWQQCTDPFGLALEPWLCLLSPLAWKMAKVSLVTGKFPTKGQMKP